MYGLYESEFILVVGWLVVCMYVCISVQRAKVYIVYNSSCCCWGLYRNILVLAQEHSCAPVVCTAGSELNLAILLAGTGMFLCQLFVQLDLSVISICLLA